MILSQREKKWKTFSGNAENVKSNGKGLISLFSGFHASLNENTPH